MLKQERLEEIVSAYQDMWRWIRDNLPCLKEKYSSITDAKQAYMKSPEFKKYGVPVVFEGCLFCEAYSCCVGCPLMSCTYGEHEYGILKKYWYDKNSDIPEEDAKSLCDTIIQAHEELKKNPTERLLDRLEDK